MADLNQMKAAAAAQGATAPPDYPGGPDAWVADWYQNAVNAGSVQGTPTQGEATATDGTTGSTPQGRKNTGTSPFADMIRAKAKAEGWSEDFERFSDQQIEAWKPHYDETAGRFRSENDPTGAATYDKPAECPEGTTFHGSKCVAWENLPRELGGGQAGGYTDWGAQGGQQGGGAAAPAAAPGRDNLQQGLIDQYQGREGQFVGAGQGAEELSGGGVFWGQQPGAPGPPPPGPTSPAAVAITSGSGATPLSAGVTPAGSSSSAAAPAPAPLSAFSGGVNQIAGGLDKAVSSAGTIDQAPAGTTALKQSLAKQYADPNQWWQKGALEA